jgi:hypothetical protein
MPAERSPWYSRPRFVAPAILLAFAPFLALSACSRFSLTNNSSSNTAAAEPAAALVGYVYDSRIQALRPVYGALGAAHLETALAALTGFRAAVPCSARGFALASDAKGSLFTLALPAGQETALADPVAPDQQIVLSPSCTNALVYSPSTGSGTLIENLPSAPRTQPITLSSSGSIAAAAVSDAGTVLFGVVSSKYATLVQVASSGTKPVSVQSLQRMGGLAFLPASDTAVVADSGANVVFLGKQVSTTPSFQPIAVSAQGVTAPRAVAASADGHYAFVANGAANNVLRIDLNSPAPPLPIACNCGATELIPFIGNANFQISDPAAGLIFALNGDAQTPRTVFVPTDDVRSSSGEAQ